MKVLFVCTHNACRSVLAEVTARQLSAARTQGAPLISASAGCAPAGRVHPRTLQYLEGLGVATSGLRSESVDVYRDFEPDLVITVCDSAACEPSPPWLEQAAHGHWGLPDPSHPAEEVVTGGTGPEDGFDEVISVLRHRLARLISESSPEMNKDQLESLVAQIAESCSAESSLKGAREVSR